MTKSNSRKNGLMRSYTPTSSKEVRIGAQDRSLEAETEAGAIEEHCLPVCSSWISLPTFLHNTEPVHSGLPNQSLIKTIPPKTSL